MGAVITGEEVRRYRIKVLQKAVELEALGMTRRGRSAYAIAKEGFGLTGNKKSVANQLKKLYEESK